MCVIIQNVMLTGQTAAEIWQFFFFFKMAAVHHIGFVSTFVHISTTNDEHLVVFITVQNLVGIDTCSSDNVQMLIFNEFGLKIPIHSKMNFFWGGGDLPLNRSSHTATHRKGNSLCRSTS